MVIPDEAECGKGSCKIKHAVNQKATFKGEGTAKSSFPASYTEIRVPGDRCLLYGIVQSEERKAGRIGCLLACSRSLKTQSELVPTALVVAFLTELARWSGTGDCHTQEDDITLIALDFRTDSYCSLASHISTPNSVYALVREAGTDRPKRIQKMSILFGSAAFTPPNWASRN